MVDWLLTNLIPEGDGYGWRVDRQALLDLRRHYDAVNLWPVLAGARGRVSCVRGAQSGYVPDQDAARMESLGCPVTTIEGAGHFLHVDQPAALLEALQTALGVDPAGGVAVE